MLVHGQNIEQKMNHPTKYRDATSRRLIAEINMRYQAWRQSNLDLTGTDFETVRERVRLLNDYKDFIDQQVYAEAFDSRSNLHSTVLEEFLFYLFKDAVPHADLRPMIGKASTFKSLYFAPTNFAQMLEQPNVRVETKDHDFTIGVAIIATFRCGATGEQTHSINVPAVAIECKTYLDKTMLEGASAAAEELKRILPSARYLIVCEFLKLTESVNLYKFKVDQIYVLRRQKNVDREFRFAPDFQKQPIYEDLVWDLFQEVVAHLSAKSWDIGARLERGKLI